MLWFATGDGGGGNNQFGHARDLASPLGKMLRIDPRPGNAGTYTIPADNPFGTARVGLRAAQPVPLLVRPRGTGDLWIGDVGQGAREEIDRARGGRRPRQGRRLRLGLPRGHGRRSEPCTLGAELHPAGASTTTQAGPRAVTGGFVVRDPGLPTLLGRYVYADAYDRRSCARSSPRQPRATGDRDDGPRRAPHDRLLRRGRLRPRLRGVARRQRRPHPGRRARAPACCARPPPGCRAAAPRRGGRAGRPARPHLAAREDPRRAQGPRRPPGDAADRAHRRARPAA